MKPSVAFNKRYFFEMVVNIGKCTFILFLFMIHGPVDNNKEVFTTRCCELFCQVIDVSKTLAGFFKA